MGRLSDQNVPIQGGTRLQTAAPSGGRLSSGLVKPKEQDQPPSAGESILNFAKNIPTTLARIVTQPVEFAEKAGSTLGKLASDAVGPILHVSPQTKAAAQSFQKGLQGNDITLPFQSEPLMRAATPFTSAREAVGSGLEAGLNLATGFLGTGAVSGVAKEGFAAVVKSLATKAGMKAAAKTILADAALGGGFGTASALQDPNATTADVVKSGLVGAGVGVVLPPILGGGIKVATEAAGLGSRLLGAGIESAATSLEKKAGRAASEAVAQKEAETAGSRILFSPVDVKPMTTTERIAEQTASALRGVQELPVKAKTAFIDKLTPINEFQKKLLSKYGIDVDLLEKFQRAGPKAAGAAQEELQNFINDGRKQFGDQVFELAKQKSRFLDATDRLLNDQPIEGGVTKEHVAADYQKFNDLNVGQMPEIDKAVGVIQKYMRKALDDAKASGRLDQAQYDNILRDHPNYIPHRVLDYIEQETPPAGRTFSGTSTKMKKAKGSERAVDDVENSITNYLFREKLNNEKNKAMNALFDSAAGHEEELGFKRAPAEMKTVDVPDGSEKVTRLNNGKLEEWLIPEDLGRAVKGLDSKGVAAVMQFLNNTTIGKVITAPARLTRFLATGANPVFAAFSNPMRDIQTVQMTAGMTALDFAKGLVSTILKDKEKAGQLYRDASEGGAFLGTVFRETDRPEEVYNRLLEKAGIGGKKLSMSRLNPLRFVEKVGQTMEEATRLGVYQNALRKGLNPDMAVKAAANATVDFSRSGSLIQVMNQVVPFLNARVQGMDNLIGALKKDPVNFVRKAMWTAAYPTMVLNAWNTKYKSYFDIPDNERRKYWIVMVGENSGRDFTGKRTTIPMYVKIPKGEAQQAISATLDRVLNIGKEKYPLETGDFLARVAGDLTPVQGSSLLPAGVQQAYELASNYSFFRGQAIVPEWIKIKGKWFKSDEVPAEYRYSDTSTSEAAKYLGHALGWSPAKIDYVIKTGVMNDALRFVDTGIDYASGKATLQKPTFKSAAQAPFLHSLIGYSEAGDIQAKKQASLKQLRDANQKLILRRMNRP